MKKKKERNNFFLHEGHRFLHRTLSYMASNPGQLHAINSQTFSRAIWSLPETKKKSQGKGRSHMLRRASIDNFDRSRKIC